LKSVGPEKSVVFVSSLSKGRSVGRRLQKRNLTIAFAKIRAKQGGIPVGKVNVPHRRQKKES